MDDIRIGVIGIGQRGHLASLAHMPGHGSRVVGAADVDSQALERFLAELPEGFVCTDYRELLDQDLDAVFVCSPDHLHEEHACAALERGIAVYLEKPMAITIEGCDRILSVAERTRSKLFVGHNMRYMGTIRKMKELIEKGSIGRVTSIWCRHFVSYGGDAYFRDWHSERRFSTGLLLQKGAHDIDVIHWLANAYTQRVSAFGNTAVYDTLPRRAESERGDPKFRKEHWPPRSQKDFSPRIDVEDQNTMIMQLEGDILGAYLQCHFTPDAWRNYTVIGTEGRIENYGDGPDAPIMVWNRRTDSFNLVGDEVHRGDTADSGGHAGADPVIVKEFVRFARGEITHTTATPFAARMSVAAGYQATMSLRNGGIPMDVPQTTGSATD